MKNLSFHRFIRSFVVCSFVLSSRPSFMDDSNPAEGSPPQDTPTNQDDTNSKNGNKKDKKKIRSGKQLIAKMIKCHAHRKYGEHLMNYRYQDVVRVLIIVKEVLKEEPMMVTCPLPCVIVGDLHGQFPDLIRVFQLFSEGESIGYHKQRYVFLGDYVDRGEQSMETIIMLFLLKIRFRKLFFLLRGNHECKAINRVYGFQAELTERFTQEEATYLFHMFNEAFTYMPLVCIVGGTIFCCHGGISPKLTKLEDINKIPKPLVDPSTSELATDLLWADPMIGCKGTRPNQVRGVSIHFGENALDEFLTRLGLKMVVRGHQMMMNGFNFFHEKKLITIFTAASYYPDKPNHGAVMYFDDVGRIGFKILVPKSDGVKIFRGEHDEANEKDIGFVQSADEIKNPQPLLPQSK